jgi:hypothetical protein
MLATMVELTHERDVDTLRDISLLLDRQNQRLIAKNLQLSAELARLRGVTDPEQLDLVLRQQLEQARRQVFARDAPPAVAARVRSVQDMVREPSPGCRAWRFATNSRPMSAPAPRVAATYFQFAKLTLTMMETHNAELD